MVKIGERGEQHKAYDATFPHTYNHGTDHYTNMYSMFAY